MSKSDLILDTDPGIDDAMAFYYAHGAPEINLIGMTTVFGNVTIENSTKNALWLAHSVGEDIPVYQGEAVPLTIPPNGPTDYVHGDDGFGNVYVTAAPTRVQSGRAAEYLVETVAKRPGEITVCAVGPLTNIAKALELDPDFMGNLKQLVVMGGALYAPGNVNEYAEANFWNDPHAAHQVVQASHEGKVVIVGLDVTTKTVFTAKDFEDVARDAPKAGGFINDISQFYMNFTKSRTGKLEAFLHDPAALVACIHLDLFETEQCALEVVTEGEELGNLMHSKSPTGTCTVCVNVKSKELVDHYKRTLSTLD